MSGGNDKLKAACLSLLGSGYLPLMSGTWGSAVAVVLFVPLWLVATRFGGGRALLEGVTLVGILVASWLSVRWGPWAIQYWRRSDPRQFTLDEFAGQWVALLALPLGLGAGWYAWLWVGGGQFFLFRVFDVLKVPPAKQAESRLRAGWGILTDDLIAGAYANLVGQLVWRLSPLAGWLGIELATR